MNHPFDRDQILEIALLEHRRFAGSGSYRRDVQIVKGVKDAYTREVERALGSSRTGVRPGGKTTQAPLGDMRASGGPLRGAKSRPGSWCRLNTSLVGRFR